MGGGGKGIGGRGRKKQKKRWIDNPKGGGEMRMMNSKNISANAHVHTTKRHLHQNWKSTIFEKLSRSFYVFLVPIRCSYKAQAGFEFWFLIKGKTSRHSSCQQQQLKFAYSTADEWPGFGLLEPNHTFLSSFPVFLCFHHCASLPFRRH